MIRIRSFSTPKDNSTNANQLNKGQGYSNTVTINKTTVDGVNIFGHYHDHTQDIAGELNNVTNINATGTINGDTINTNNGNITNLNSTTIETDDLVVNDDAEIQDAEIENLHAENGAIDNLTSLTATIENLTVTKAAHFYQLIIDEVRSTQGQIMVTPANAKIVSVTGYDYGSERRYELDFLANDETTGRQLYNSFEIDDQVVCQTFNAATGENYNIDNRFYWARVVAKSSTPITRRINGVPLLCHYIILTWADKDPNTNAIPQIGDEVVVLGNRTDSTRQSAVSIGGYDNPFLDPTIHAPFIIQYAGINDYNLASHRKNVISNGYNYFNGVFTTTTGDNIEDLINDIAVGALTYIHTAYSTSADGQTDFSKSYFTDAIYMGICSNRTESDASLTYTDYQWMRIKGEDGGTAVNYTLSPLNEIIPIDANGTVGATLRYNILRVEGTTITKETTSDTLNVWYKLNFEQTITNWVKCQNGTQTPQYVDAQIMTDYSTSNDKLISIEVVCGNGSPAFSSNSVYDKRIVYPTLLPSASFEITDSIKSTVQGHTTSINSLTNSITTIEQDVDSITSTVESHTTTINNIDGRVTQNTTDISRISQTATEIELKVNNTGINLVDGTITLNAGNTIINGNLNLTENGQGLILYDAYGNPKITIQNETLGTLENFDFGADKYLRTSKSINIQTPQYTLTFDPITLGTFAAGQRLKLHGISIATHNEQAVWEKPDSLTYSMVIKNGSTTVDTINGTCTTDGLYYYIADYESTLSRSGDYSVTITLTGAINNVALYGQWSHSIYLYVRTTQPNINKICVDGAVFASDIEHYNWFGQDKTQIRNGASAIRLNNGKVERNSYNPESNSFINKWSDLSSTLPYNVVNELTYTATANDAIIAFSTVVGESDGARRTVTLPTPDSMPGKFFIIKNIVGGNTHLVIEDGSRKIMYATSATLESDASVSGRLVSVYSIGLYWLKMDSLG